MEFDNSLSLLTFLKKSRIENNRKVWNVFFNISLIFFHICQIYQSPVWLFTKIEILDRSFSWILSSYPLRLFITFLKRIWKSFESQQEFPHSQVLDDSKQFLARSSKVNWDHSFSTCAKFSEKLTFLTSWYAHVPVH